MAIDNLTGTTWYVPSGWTAEAGYGVFGIDFKLYPDGVMTDFRGSDSIRIGYGEFNGDEFLETSNAIAFWENVASSYNYGSPYVITNSSSFVLEITGSVDVDKTEIIEWLTTYGTQLKVDDLTNTTWTVDAYWEAESGYGVFSINGYHSLAPNMDFDTIMLGYSDVDFPEANWYFDFPAKMSLYSPVEILITITSGDDVTNPKLIAWLSKYGELQVEEEPDTPETTTSQGEIYYKGELVATLVEGETIVLHTKDFKFLGDIVIKNVGEVEEETNTVNITLSGALDYSASASFTGVHIKFGSPPTSNTDYDYTTIQGFNLYDREGNYITTPTSVSVSPIAYIWQDYVDTNAGYILNGGSLITTNNSYTAPTEINLNEGDTLTLACTQD